METSTLASTADVYDLYSGVVLKIFSQPAYECIQASSGEEVIISPDMQQDGFAFQHGISVQDE